MTFDPVIAAWPFLFIVYKEHMSLDIKDIDPAAQRIIDNIDPNLSQAQYSTHDQLCVIYQLARKMKLYDAAEVIARLLDDRG